VHFRTGDEQIQPSARDELTGSTDSIAAQTCLTSGWFWLCVSIAIGQWLTATSCRRSPISSHAWRRPVLVPPGAAEEIGREDRLHDDVSMTIG
jgi:hypothetical protein